MSFCSVLTPEEKKQSSKEFVRLSVPIVLSRSVSVGSEFVMAIMLSSVDEDHLAASGLINAIQSLILRTGMNVLYPTGIAVSRELAVSPKSIGEILYASYLVAISLSAVFLPLLTFSSGILKKLGQPSLACSLTETYFRYYAFGVPATLLTISSQQASYKLNAAWMAFLIGLTRRALYLFMGYGLLNGKLGMPKLGIAGVGLANAVSVWFDQLVFVVYFFLSSRFSDYAIFSKISFNHNIFKYSKEIVKAGIVMGSDAINDFVVNFASVLLVGLKGVGHLNAAEIASQYKNFLTIPITGMAQVSGMILRSEQNITKRKAKGTLFAFLSILFPILLVPTCFAISDELIYLFLGDHPKQETKSLTKSLLAIILVGIFPFDVQKILAGNYRGSEKYFLSFIINFFSTAVFGLGVGCLLDYKSELSSKGVYLGVALGITLASFLMTYCWIKSKLLTEEETPLLLPVAADGIPGSPINSYSPGTFSQLNSASHDQRGEDQKRFSCAVT